MNARKSVVMQSPVICVSEALGLTAVVSDELALGIVRRQAHPSFPRTKCGKMRALALYNHHWKQNLATEAQGLKIELSFWLFVES